MAELLFELRRGQVLQAAVWPDLVVVLAPGFDDDAGLAARAEPFDGQALVAEFAIEAFIGAVLPRLARIVEHRVSTSTPIRPLRFRRIKASRGPQRRLVFSA